MPKIKGKFKQAFLGNGRFFIFTILAGIVLVALPSWYGWIVAPARAAGPYTVCASGCDFTTLTDAFASTTLTVGATINVNATYSSSTETFPLTFAATKQFTVDCNSNSAIIGSTTTVQGVINLAPTSTLQNCNLAFVSLASASGALRNVSIINNIFATNTTSSLSFNSGLNNFTINNNTNFNNLNINGSSVSGTISNNIIYYKYFSTFSSGISLGTGSTNVVITSNTISNNTALNNVGNYSLISLAGDSLTVSSNTLSYPTNPGFQQAAINVNSTGTITFVSNTIALPAGMSGAVGIGLTGPTNATGTILIDHNTITVPATCTSCTAINITDGNTPFWRAFVTSTYNILYKSGAVSGSGIAVGENSTNSTITFYNDYNGIYGFATNLSNTQNANFSLGANTLTLDPFLRLYDSDASNDSQPALFSNYLDINGTLDIGAFSGVRRNTITVNSAGTIDYSAVDATTTLPTDAFRAGDTITVAAGNYYTFTVSSTMATSSITLTGAGAGSSIVAVSGTAATFNNISNLTVSGFGFNVSSSLNGLSGSYLNTSTWSNINVYATSSLNAISFANSNTSTFNNILINLATSTNGFYFVTTTNPALTRVAITAATSTNGIYFINVNAPTLTSVTTTIANSSNDILFNTVNNGALSYLTLNAVSSTAGLNFATVNTTTISNSTISASSTANGLYFATSTYPTLTRVNITAVTSTGNGVYFTNVNFPAFTSVTSTVTNSANDILFNTVNNGTFNYFILNAVSSTAGLNFTTVNTTTISNTTVSASSTTNGITFTTGNNNTFTSVVVNGNVTGNVTAFTSVNNSTFTGFTINAYNASTTNGLALSSVNTSTFTNLTVQNASSTLASTYTMTNAIYSYGGVTYNRSDAIGDPINSAEIIGADCNGITPVSADGTDVTANVGTAANNWNLVLVYFGANVASNKFTAFVPNDVAASGAALEGICPLHVDLFVANAFTVSGGAFTYGTAAVAAANASLVNGYTSPPRIDTVVNGNAGLKLTNSNNNLFTYVTSTANGFGVYFTGTSGGNSVSSSVFTTNTLYDIKSDSSNTNNLKNISFLTASTTITGTGNVNVYEKTRAYITDNNAAALNNAAATFTDGNSAVSTVLTTDSTGYTPFSDMLLAFIMNSTSVATTNGGYNPYSITTPIIGTLAAKTTSASLTSPNQTVNIALSLTPVNNTTPASGGWFNGGGGGGGGTTPAAITPAATSTAVSSSTTILPPNPAPPALITPANSPFASDVFASSLIFPTPLPANNEFTPFPSPSFKAVFIHFLTMGASGAEVRALQTVLFNLGYFKHSVTGYFGAVTKLALQKFQRDRHLAPAPGYVGPGTRAALNALVRARPTLLKLAPAR